MICILCGGSSPIHPLHPTDTLLELVNSRACKGPIVWKAIMEWDQPTVCACRMCFHQLRRVKPRSRDRQPLPLDAAVLQTMMPGTMRQQDSRTRERICAALRMPGNAYSRVFEALGSLLHMEAEISAKEEKRGAKAGGCATPMPQSKTEEMEEERGGNEEEDEAEARAEGVPAQSPRPTTMTITPPKIRMEAWWRYNLQTECFSHKAIARHVRRSGL
jgi:hypothetical protein